MGQYCFADWRLSSSVTMPAVGPASRRARGRWARRRPGVWAVGWPTLHGGPVVLRPVRATPCFTSLLVYWINTRLMTWRCCVQLCSGGADRRSVDWRPRAQVLPWRRRWNRILYVDVVVVGCCCRLLRPIHTAPPKQNRTELEEVDAHKNKNTIRYGRFTCAQKLTTRPAKSSARHRNEKIRKN